MPFGHKRALWWQRLEKLRAPLSAAPRPMPPIAPSDVAGGRRARQLYAAAARRWPAAAATGRRLTSSGQGERKRRGKGGAGRLQRGATSEASRAQNASERVLAALGAIGPASGAGRHAFTLPLFYLCPTVRARCDLRPPAPRAGAVTYPAGRVAAGEPSPAADARQPLDVAGAVLSLYRRCYRRASRRPNVARASASMAARRAGDRAGPPNNGGGQPRNNSTSRATR